MLSILVPVFAPRLAIQPKTIPQYKSLNEFSKALDTCSVQQVMLAKESLRTLLNADGADIKQLNHLLQKMMRWAVDHHSQEVAFFLADILDQSKWLALAQHKEPHQNIRSALELAKQQADDYPLQCVDSRLNIEWHKFRPLVIYFVPNIINIFLDTFNFLDNQRHFTSLWEKYLLLEIIYKFVLIPFTLIHALNPILVAPVKVYSVAILIIAGAGLLVAAYKKWLKPIPHEIVNCQNLDKMFTHKKVKPKVGQSAALDRLIAALLAGSNVLIVGKSGEGKTALAHHLVQLKKEGRLPQQLESLRMFALNCGDLMGHGTFGHAEMINQTKENIEGFEKKFLIFFDEMDQFAANPSCFQTFKERFLNEDEHRPKIIAACTLKGLEKIRQVDTDGSFMQRVVPIFIESATDQQCRLVINEFLNRKARALPIKEEAIEKILELSASDTYLPEIGRLAKVKKIMRATLGRCRWAYSPQYISKELSQARDEYRIFQTETTYHMRKDPDRLKKKQALANKIAQLEAELDMHKEQMSKIKGYLQKRSTFKSEFCKLTHHLAMSANKISQRTQNLYLLYHLYGEEAIESKLDQEVKRIKDKMDAQIDAPLVEQVFEQMRDGLLPTQINK
jgi:ABC-type oligopeptide transport system ATPase subunit